MITLEREGSEQDVSNVRESSTDNIVFVCCILILQTEQTVYPISYGICFSCGIDSCVGN